MKIVLQTDDGIELDSFTVANRSLAQRAFAQAEAVAKGREASAGVQIGHGNVQNNRF